MKKIKIVDLSSLIPGPMASYLLAKHLGSEVTKFEDINNRDQLADMRPSQKGIGIGYSLINESKKIMVVDYRRDGLAQIKEAVKTADIFVENFKGDRAYKMGLGFEDLKAINPAIIYCSIKGYDNDHKLAGKAAHDLNILAVSGYLALENKLGRELLPPTLQWADLFTSYHLALRLMAVVLAGKKGVRLAVSMAGAFVEATSLYIKPYELVKREVEKSDFILAGAVPCYNIYEAKDGRYVAVAAVEKTLWIDFCDQIGREDLSEKQYDPLYIKEVAGEMAKYDFGYWLKNKEFDFCVTPVLTIAEAEKIVHG